MNLKNFFSRLISTILLVKHANFITSVMAIDFIFYYVTKVDFPNFNNIELNINSFHYTSGNNDYLCLSSNIY